MLTKQDILEEFNEELPATHKMLERVPFDKLDFKPSPKSMPLSQMAFMVGSMPSWFIDMIEKDGINTDSFVQPPAPKDAKELARAFDEGAKKVQVALTKMDDAALKGTWSLTMKGKTIMALPRGVILRQTINHLVHHRAQLGLYLKILGVPHPAVYGSSGDES